MRIVSESDLEWSQSRTGVQRGGQNESKSLLNGEPGALDNFDFWISRAVGSGNTSPRHRHNFDQFRFALRGEHDSGPDVKVPEGWLAYFPEGAFYGPFTSVGGESRTLLILQVSGASGDGYIGWDKLRSSGLQLRTQGEFVGGIFTYTDASGKMHKQDGHQAVWEHAAGRSISYPAPRYEKPLVINPGAFHWVATDQPGVATKCLGIFNERGTGTALFRLEESATWRLEPELRTRLLFTLTGGVLCDGAQRTQHTAIQIGPGEGPIDVRALGSTVEVLEFLLPSFSPPAGRESDRADRLVASVPDGAP